MLISVFLLIGYGDCWSLIVAYLGRRVKNDTDGLAAATIYPNDNSPLLLFRHLLSSLFCCCLFVRFSTLVFFTKSLGAPWSIFFNNDPQNVSGAFQ